MKENKETIDLVPYYINMGQVGDIVKLEFGKYDLLVEVIEIVESIHEKGVMLFKGKILFSNSSKRHFIGTTTNWGFQDTPDITGKVYLYEKKNKE